MAIKCLSNNNFTTHNIVQYYNKNTKYEKTSNPFIELP